MSISQHTPIVGTAISLPKNWKNNVNGDDSNLSLQKSPHPKINILSTDSTFTVAGLMILDCYQFYLWSIGELKLPERLAPQPSDFL
ncbi:MAG: hypothetical protein A4S09_15180 [Proteobacteria bacterium SG_bin7]|nr:MAG: hypothetical protein A4S09_15180 [Proteobacteria bacterium SG_bin7]